MAIHRVKLKDLLSGTVSLDMETGDTHTVVVGRQRADFIEFADTLFRNNSGVLLPSETSPSADGIPHPGLDVVAACLNYAKAHPAKSIFVTGHTDTVGSDEANVRLSEIRVQVVHAMLVGDRATFANGCFGPHLTFEQRYPNNGDGSKAGTLWSDYSDVLNWIADNFGWDCQCGYPGGAPWIYDATLSFQEAYNASSMISAEQPAIKASGMFDEPTWGAVYDCYNQKLAELLETDGDGLTILRSTLQFVRPDIPFVGCGEYKPLDQVGSNDYHSQTNRRVEVIYFDPGEEPLVPCFDGVCVPDICELYDSNWFKRRPLPLGAVAWTAAWDRDGEPAFMDDSRKMILTAPDLPDGEIVTFDVYANGRGPIGKRVEAIASGGAASAEWNTWFDELAVEEKVALQVGESFPSVTLDFVATATGTETRSPPLAYSDRLCTQLMWRLQGEDGLIEEPMVEIDYTLYSPFGTRQGKTVKDAGSDGWAIEEGLPPGGVTIVLSNGSIAISNT
jgi:outer membrane protein OmpA-like peptidoglycan-associated protein